MRLRLNQCDEVNHDGVRYPVSNSGRHLDVGEVIVPDHVGSRAPTRFRWCNTRRGCRARSDKMPALRSQLQEGIGPWQLSARP
jgi:hypothetical protein